MADFLFEIGLEEVPARMIAGAEAELLRRVLGMLRRESLLGEDHEETARSFSTPRRLAVLVSGVFERQSDTTAKVMGPAVKIAFKDGQPTAAAEAFARKNGVSVAELKIEATAKGEYLLAEVSSKGRGAAEVIAAEMPKELAGIYWAKNMYWRAGKPERFVRPVRWMVALLGEAVVPVSFGGYEAGRRTYGHRVLFGAAAIEIGSAGEYVEALRGASVLVEVEGRRHTIRKALDRVCRGIPGASGPDTRWREDHALVDKMTHMTEWPSVIAGAFEGEYLTLPEEVLVTVMRDHQNYFAVETKDGRLAPHFLAVLNTVADAGGEAVIRHGNERVLRARFNDARFFWDFDQRVTLEERVGLLDKVTFQKDLGSYRRKSERVDETARELARVVAERGGVFDAEGLWTATRLAKTDLTTELVKEFTELQGVVGGLYAQAQGAGESAARAIYDQYRPVSMEDEIPATVEGRLLSLADKADTIAGMFGLGLEPTGSKDPFALRRAGNGVVRILAESELPLTLADVVEAVIEREVAAKMAGFLRERLEFYLREAAGQAYDVVKAVLAAGGEDVRDAVARAEAVTAMRGSEDFLAVSGAFKRMKNILNQAGEDGSLRELDSDVQAGSVPAQVALAAAFLASRGRMREKTKQRDYMSALCEMASLRPQVDAFFEQILVMDPDAQIRGDRLRLLSGVVWELSRTADFSEIVVAG